jgi:hypothetical protein
MKLEETVTVTGKQLTDIYLDGFVSGISSTLSTFSKMSDEQIMHISQHLCGGLFEAEDGKAMLLKEIQERLDGTDSGPKKAVVDVYMGKIPLGPDAN